MGLMRDVAVVVLGGVVVAGACFGAEGAATVPASTQKGAGGGKWPVGKAAAPAELPGKGLAGHDFFYAGEAKTQDMYIVRKGAVAWEFHGGAGAKGEISDAELLSNGEVLFAHQYGVTLMDAGKKVLWNFDAPEKSEIHTAQAIGKEHVLFIVNGPEPRCMVVNVGSGAVEKEFALPVKNVKSTHGQFRHARLTEQGTLLVAHMDMGKVAEYDENGKEVWSMNAPGVWAATRLKNGNLLVTGKTVKEMTPAGEVVWEFGQSDIPDYKVVQFQVATRLASGDTVVNNWVNQWNGAIDAATAPVQVWEVTPEKQVVWALREWGAGSGVNLGPATIVQILDDASGEGVEEVRFGGIR